VQLTKIASTLLALVAVSASGQTSERKSCLIKLKTSLAENDKHRRLEVRSAQGRRIVP
jgi:hypothetical protein